MNFQKLRNFENFNFQNNQVWNEYIKDIDKSVPVERIEKLKKIWYKDNIDPDFDPEFKGSSTQQQQSHTHTFQQPNSGDYQSQPLIKKTLFDAENILKVVFIISALLQTGLTTIVGIVVCLLAIYRQLKTPSWTKEYGRKAFQNEFTHNLLFIIGFVFVNSFKILYTTPIILHFLVGLAAYLNLRKGFLYTTFKKYVDAINAQKQDLMNMKYRVEIALVPILIVLVFLQSASLFVVIYYANFLRIKYFINDQTKIQCGWVKNKYLQPHLNKPVIGQIIQMVLKVCAWLSKDR